MIGFALTRYASRDALAEGLAQLLAAKLSEIAADQGHASIALPGGTTPGPTLAHLSRATLKWETITVTLTDERWVPATSPRSNERLLRETLLRGPAAAARFVPLYVATAAPEAGLETVRARLVATALPLDIAVLGMGADCHTASLFPGTSGLERALAADAPAALAITAPGTEEPRVTLSARVLAAARERHILIEGGEKRAALDRALAVDDQKEAPILALLEGARVHYAD